MNWRAFRARLPFYEHYLILERNSMVRQPLRSIALAISATCALSANAINGSDGNDLPLEDLRLFAQVFDQIRQAYVDEVDDKTLLHQAIAGMLQGLDAHSSYLVEDAYTDLQESTRGTFGGIGIEVGLEDGFIKVVSPIDDTPAQRAGIQAGDLIIKIDDQLVKGLSLQEAVAKMRGPRGSEIRLSILREGSGTPIELTLLRDTIRVSSVRSQELEPGFGYIRIAQFQDSTARQFRGAIQELGKSGDTELKGLVLDLRNNPGGLLQASIDVSNTLLEEGIIVSTRGRIAGANSNAYASLGDLLNGLPVVVLINGGTASAAEIVAGALQDHRRALIIGTRSFGKGSVQTVLPLDESRAIKLTTARYYTPSGRSIQVEGIQPDILVERATIQPISEGGHVSESSLQRHLSNENGSQARPLAAEPASAIEDNQLFEALNILKGLTILSSRPAATP